MNDFKFLNVHPNLFAASNKTEEELDSSENGVLFYRKHITFSDLVLKMAKAIGLEMRLASNLAMRFILHEILIGSKLENAEKMLDSLLRMFENLDQLPPRFRDRKRVEAFWLNNNKTKETLKIWQKFRNMLQENNLMTTGDILARFLESDSSEIQINMEGAEGFRFVGFKKLSPIQLEAVLHLSNIINTEFVINMPASHEKLYGPVLKIEEYLKKRGKDSNINVVFNEPAFYQDSQRNAVLSKLFGSIKDSNDKGASLPSDKRLKLFRPADEKSQLRFVFDEIATLLESGNKPQDIAIVASNIEGIRPYLREAIVKRGLPIAYNRSVSVLKASCFNWINKLMDILNNGLVFSKIRVLQEELTPFSLLPESIRCTDATVVESVLKELGIEKESQSWKKSVRVWTKKQSEKNVEHFVDIENWIESWKEWIVGWQQDKTRQQWLCYFSDMLAKVTLPQFYSYHEARHYTLSYQALKTVRNIVSEWKNNESLKPVVYDGKQFLTWLIHMIDLPIRQRSSPEPETVVVLTPEEASQKTFKHLYFVNMLEGVFPAAPKKNSLLREKEMLVINKRAGMAIFEGTAVNYQREQMTFIDILFGSENVSMYAPMKIKGEMQNASLFMTELSTLVEMDEDTSIDSEEISKTMDEWFFDAVTFIRKNGVKDLVSILPSEILGHLEDVATRADLEEGRASVMHKKDAEIRKDASTEYSGDLGENWEELCDYQLGNMLSSSWFEEYSSCPFKFFLNRILNIEEWQKVARDPDNLKVGSALHSVMEKLFKSNRISGNESQQELEDIAKAYMEEALKDAVENPEYVTTVIIPFAAKTWAVYVRKMYHNESDNIALKPPVMFEKTFGEDKEDDLSGLINVSGDDNNPLYIRGRIDRLDANEHETTVLDYKSGKNKYVYEPKIKKQFAITSFQMPLYMLGLMAAIKRKRLKSNPEEISARYLLMKNSAAKIEKKINLKDKSVQEYFSLDPDVRADKTSTQSLANRLVEIYQSIKNGEFQVSPIDSKQACTYCPYLDICRYDNTKIEFPNMEAEI